MNQERTISRANKIADLSVVLLLAGLVSLYLIDAIRASADILNLILILPVSSVVLVLCTVQFILDIRRDRTASLPIETRESPSESPQEQVAPAMGLFAVYVLTLAWLGFDVGTCLFLAAFLWLRGERRWPWLIGYSIGLASFLTFFFSRMLPYPMPLLILGTS